MKQTLLALATLAASAPSALAQSSVTVYGSFDAGVRYQSHQNAAGNSKVSMSSTGTYNSNRIGFKGVEDLGDGLNAHFSLETGFNSGTGALDNPAKQFNRSNFVGLTGKWGTVDFGRQYTVAFKAVGGYEPFNYKFPLIVPLAIGATAGTRYDNNIQYTGTFGPITARAEWALGEQAGGSRNNAAQAVGVTYANGPLTFGGAYTLRKPNVAAASTAANYQDNRYWTLGGAYTFGAARIAAGYARENQDLVVGSTQQKNAWVGGTYEFTPAVALTAGYYDTKVENVSNTGTDGKRQLFIVAATYALSKRTNFYANIDYARFKGALALPANATGLPAGNFLAGGTGLLGLTSGCLVRQQT